ncbi:MAG: SDR family oxidoreductase [Proteobacteria bacterium]|nr:SDR family oxidoreductase [Pseudomonadota bacterium]
MDLGLNGRVVLVTGASGGIGEAMVSAFAAEGATVVAQGHTRFDTLKTRFEGTAVVPWRADLSSVSDVDALFDGVAERFGRIDVLAANAGRWPLPNLRLHETPVDDIEATLSDNLRSAILSARAFMRVLAQTGPDAMGHGASVVLTGSTAGRFGEAGHAAYAVAKAGLLGLARTLKNELPTLDPWARINVVEPGWTATPRVRKGLADPTGAQKAAQTMALRQLARCEDIARTAVFLSSPTAARHITGEVLTVAGGMEGRRLWDPEEVDVDLLRRRLDAD